MTTTLPGPRRADGGSAGTELMLTVVAADMVADGVRSITLAKPDAARLPDWAPGAHIDLFLPGDRVRQYSLCGDRWDAHTYRIAVLREPDGRGGSAFVHDQLSIGDTVGVGGPRNNFALAPAGQYLFIAGGIGITPILPMIHQARIQQIPWTLLYGGRSLTSMAFADELASHGSHVRIWPRDTLGLLPLRTAFGELGADAKVYCCGPAPLLAAVQAEGADLAPGRLRTERFVADPLTAPVRSTAFTVRMHRSGIELTVRPDQSILDALSQAGSPMLSSCGRGLCGTCETTVLDGIPDHRDSLLTDDERAANDVMLPCVSRACSDRIVLDL